MRKPNLSRKAVLAATLAGVIAAVPIVAGCGGSEDAEAAIPGGKRTIYLTAMEYKGSTEVSKEAFPTSKLPEGGGYKLVEPTGNPAKWEVSSYSWAPATIVVAENDQVTLQIMGVNGAEHVATIEAHGSPFTVKRGQLTTVTFTAGKPGVYAITCATHQPGMTGHMVVLPAKK